MINQNVSDGIKLIETEWFWSMAQRLISRTIHSETDSRISFQEHFHLKCYDHVTVEPLQTLFYVQKGPTEFEKVDGLRNWTYKIDCVSIIWFKQWYFCSTLLDFFGWPSWSQLMYLNSSEICTVTLQLYIYSHRRGIWPWVAKNNFIWNNRYGLYWWRLYFSSTRTIVSIWFLHLRHHEMTLAMTSRIFSFRNRTGAITRLSLHVLFKVHQSADRAFSRS